MKRSCVRQANVAKSARLPRTCRSLAETRAHLVESSLVALLAEFLSKLSPEEAKAVAYLLRGEYVSVDNAETAQQRVESLTDAIDESQCIEVRVPSIS